MRVPPRRQARGEGAARRQARGKAESSEGPESQAEVWRRTGDSLKSSINSISSHVVIALEALKGASRGIEIEIEKGIESESVRFTVSELSEI